eukprot:814435-Rhodomonas_salina.1
MGGDGRRWEAMGGDGMRWDAMGCDGMRWEAMGCVLPGELDGDGTVGRNLLSRPRNEGRGRRGGASWPLAAAVDALVDVVVDAVVDVAAAVVGVVVCRDMRVRVGRCCRGVSARPSSNSQSDPSSPQSVLVYQPARRCNPVQQQGCVEARRAQDWMHPRH